MTIFAEFQDIFLDMAILPEHLRGLDITAIAIPRWPIGCRSIYFLKLGFVIFII